MVLTKDELIAHMRHEAHILNHLTSKVRPEDVDYRPSAKQRSTLELLRYLTFMAPLFADAMKTGVFDNAAWGVQEAVANALDFGGVKAKLAGLGDVLAGKLSAITDEEFRMPIEMFGQTASRGATFVRIALCGHAAYRTQLFTYLKANGRQELNTMNLWAGMDGEESM